MLRDLNKLASESRKSFLSDFQEKDRVLSNDFKKHFTRVLEDSGGSIQYQEYTARIRTSAGNKIFCPNQWFFISTFVVEFASELNKYKNILEEIANTGEFSFPRKDFWRKIRSLKNTRVEEIDKEIKESIDQYFKDDSTSKERMCIFITDYSWWHGSKTIDRGDFTASPILKILGLVNVSQAFVNDIVNHLASDNELMSSATKMRENIKDSSSIIGQNLIVYGAPGTGKSNYLNKNFRNITRTVFHPDYSYYDFVGNYKPVPIYKETDKDLYQISGKEFTIGEPRIDYRFVPGPFINVLLASIQNPYTIYTLLIEEINRANAATVFGDIFQLLDRDDTGKSEYTINLSEELKAYINSLGLDHHFENGLFIPNNMNIVATMNSADQGVFVLDTAFKRRWNYIYIPIREEGFIHENRLVKYGGKDVQWKDLLTAINNKLKELDVKEDQLIGPYFIKPSEIDNSEIVSSKLLIYLWDDVMRYRRSDLFDGNYKTYSELVDAYNDGEDILGINANLN